MEASLRIALSSQSSSSSATHNMEGAELQITRSLTAEETLPISEFNSIPSLTSKPQKIGGDIADSAEASLESTEPSLESSSSSVEMAWIPSLSVQQLVDCDTSFNRGCSGGSPLFAFHYIADNGLVPWSRYEYEEKVKHVLLLGETVYKYLLFGGAICDELKLHVSDILMMRLSETRTYSKCIMTFDST